MKRFLVLLLLFCSTVAAQTFEIKGPANKIKGGKLQFLPVTGIDESIKDKLQQPKVEPFDDSVTCALLGDVIVFEAEPKQDTKYTITIGLNEWRKGAETFLVGMKSAGVPKEVIDRQVELLNELEKTHPYRYGTCVVEVAGSVPFSPTDPNQPAPQTPTDPNRKVSQVTYVFEKDTTSVPRPVSLALRRINAESSGFVVATEFEEDTLNALGQVPEQYKIALAEARKAGLPALVVQSGATVLRVLKAPTTEEQVIEASK